MGSETQSLMSDMVSVDSGPESEYNFGDLEEENKAAAEGKAPSRLPRRLSSIKPAKVEFLAANEIAIGGREGRPPAVLGSVGPNNASSIIDKIKEKQ